MKKILLALALGMVAIPGKLIAQVDSIFYTNGEKIGCNVLKVTTNEIEYSYEGESTVNVEEKQNVSKIVFKSGRTQLITSSETLQAKEKKHGQFWGIDLGINYKDFVQQLTQKGAKILEYQDHDEVKLESSFMDFESADIYVHYDKDGIVYLVDVQQNHAMRRSAAKEMKKFVKSMNEKYKLVKDGPKPWVLAFYKWQWEGDNVVITLNRAGGYARPHVRFHEVGTIVNTDD
ncbi:MAG: hypothetical protein IK131_07235 [Paludibacteraceae bacterium]|jgi:hypothetical protein|nr:hypothetical protein [Paludibacteraceae bacterium]